MTMANNGEYARLQVARLDGLAVVIRGPSCGICEEFRDLCVECIVEV